MNYQACPLFHNVGFNHWRQILFGFLFLAHLSRPSSEKKPIKRLPAPPHHILNRTKVLQEVLFCQRRNIFFNNNILVDKKFATILSQGNLPHLFLSL